MLANAATTPVFTLTPPLLVLAEAAVNISFTLAPQLLVLLHTPSYPIILLSCIHWRKQNVISSSST